MLDSIEEISRRVPSFAKFHLQEKFHFHLMSHYDERFGIKRVVNISILLDEMN